MASQPTPRPTRRSTVAVAPRAHAAQAGSWRIDAANSALQISVKIGFLATVTGRFTDISGRVNITDGLLDSRIAVEVGTNSLTSGSKHWDSVLMNAGLIDTATNPTIAFESTGLTERGAGWELTGVLVTERGCLPVTFDLECLSDLHDAARLRFRATGSLASKDAVRLLSQPGVDKLIGKQMSVDLLIEAFRD